EPWGTAAAGAAVRQLELGRPEAAEPGDSATAAGLTTARVMRQDPKVIAARLAETIEVAEGAATAEASGGYVNFRLADDWLRRLVGRVRPGYGARDIGHGERLQVEFGSVNPTGPLHIGHGRGVTLGDSICRLLEFTGHKVQREKPADRVTEGDAADRKSTRLNSSH